MKNIRLISYLFTKVPITHSNPIYNYQLVKIPYISLLLKNNHLSNYLNCYNLKISIIIKSYIR